MRRARRRRARGRHASRGRARLPPCHKTPKNATLTAPAPPAWRGRRAGPWGAPRPPGARAPQGPAKSWRVRTPGPLYPRPVPRPAQPACRRAACGAPPVTPRTIYNMQWRRRTRTCTPRAPTPRRPRVPRGRKGGGRTNTTDYGSARPKGPARLPLHTCPGFYTHPSFW
ncbi:MAG: hypothetical protein J3K34DRAFT_411050 [Monoraphidium minutum]|nr:MAG: hypothetical protein J3K34DRAFT_411050 [Monoraphidium minutum]